MSPLAALRWSRLVGEEHHPPHPSSPKLARHRRPGLDAARSVASAQTTPGLQYSRDRGRKGSCGERLGHRAPMQANHGKLAAPGLTPGRECGRSCRIGKHALHGSRGAEVGLSRWVRPEQSPLEAWEWTNPFLRTAAGPECRQSSKIAKGVPSTAQRLLFGFDDCCIKHQAVRSALPPQKAPPAPNKRSSASACAKRQAAGPSVALQHGKRHS